MTLDPQWTPPCDMKRIIVHWTAGAYRASGLDKQHYHILIQGDGSLVRGDHSIASNEHSTGPRASHTLNCNTCSIGVAVCCMSGAQESPFDAGQFPMTETQWDAMARVVAELCERYDIPVTSQTVLAHGEVEKNLNIKQRGKWDPVVLPWAPTTPRAQVMEGFRAAVRRYREVFRAPRPVPIPAPTADRAPSAEETMAEDVTVASTNFYQVVPGGIVTLEIITGDGQVSGSALLLNGRPLPFVQGSGPQPIGTNLAGSVLNVRTIVRDINPATNRTSVTYRLAGGAEPRDFPFAIEVSADKGAAHYLIAFVFTNEVV